MIAARSHGITHEGLQREHNEDGFGVWPEDGLHVVCDGMGGSSGGEVATRVALDAVHEGYRENRTQGGADRLEAAVKLANRRVFEKSNSQGIYRGIGAAIAAVALADDAVHIAHVGDCRVYRYRTLDLALLTRDHSLVNEYRIYKPDVTDEELAAVPTNIITRALGMTEDVKVELREERARAGDLYLLSTDGLHGAIDDEAIAGILYDQIDLHATSAALVQAALDAGGFDNIACVLVRLALG